MQIFKTTVVKAIDATGVDTSGELPLRPQAPVEGDPAITDAVNDFFGEEGTSATTGPAAPDNPFDLLFAGAPTAPGTIAADGSPSIDDFAPSKVVTVEDWLMAHPEGRYILDQFITKMETVREKRFVREKKALEELLAKGGMSPQETLVVQEKIEELDAVIAKIDQEIEKAGDRMAAQNEIYTKEFYAVSDLNGDGYVGDPMDDTSYIVAKHPVTGQDILLDHNKKPVVDPFMDRQYSPALLSTDSVQFAENPDISDTAQYKEGTFVALKLNGTKHAQGLGYADNTFGAQIDITAAEGFWVEAGDDGKPKTKRNELGDKDQYLYKPLEVITFDGGRQMIGQKPPTEEELKKYIFVRSTKLNIFSEETGKQDKSGVDIDGGHVFFEFQDAGGNLILRLRVEGITTSNASPLASGQLADGKYYIAASTVGVAVNDGTHLNDGTDEEGNPINHTTRVRPMEINASSFESTGRVLPELNGNYQDFYDELGIDAEINSHGSIKQNQFGVTDKDDQLRAQNAANFTLRGGFLNPDPSPMASHYNMDREAVRNALEQGKLLPGAGAYGTAVNTSEEIAKKFGVNKKGKAAFSAVYLSSKEGKYDEYRTGVFIKGIRGVIRGTSDNDIIVVPPPNRPEIEALLAYGATETTPDRATYGTVVEGGRGRNIVVSKGGDLYASGVSFLWRDSEKAEEQLWISTNQGATQMVGDEVVAGKGNQAVFVRIGDTNPGLINIDNKEDANEYHVSGTKDDWWDVPDATQFTNLAESADLPPGFDTNSQGSTPDVINTKITTARDDITTAIEDFFKIDPMNSEIEVGEEWGKKFEELEASQNSFFEEWDFFSPEEDEGDEVGDVTNE